MQTTVAILEPHAISRSCIQESLTKLDYQVLIHSGESILFLEELADAEQLPDIIISEPQLVDLPDISIFRHLRFHYPSAILVAYTSPGSQWNLETASSQGAHALLPKDCSLHELQQTLNALKGAGNQYNYPAVR